MGSPFDLFRYFLPVLLLALPAALPATGADLGDLDGLWIEVVDRRSREEHPSPLAPLDAAILVVDGRQFTWKHGDRTSRQSLVKFVPGQKFRAFDLMTVVGDEFGLSRAIYKLEGDTLTLCEAAREEPRPTEFRRMEGVGEPRTALTIYKRQRVRSSPKVGEVAPEVEGVAPDGSPFEQRALAGKVVLLTFWRTDDAALERHFAKLREVRRAFISVDKLQIVSLRIDGSGFAEWLTFLDRQPPLDPEFPLRRIYDDPKWWHYFHASVGEAGQNPYDVGRSPESFVIGPDGRLLAARVPDADLASAVTKALNAQR